MLDRTTLGLAVALALYAGCTSSDSDSEGGGGVGAVNDGVVTSAAVTTGAGNGGSGGGNDGGGGGSGLPECPNTSGLTPPSGPYACGSVGCADGSVCVESERSPENSENCLIHFCVSVPPACEATPTCDCLSDLVDYQATEPPTCSETGGKLKLHGEHLWNPPWIEPACPGQTCGANESCWGCVGDGFHGSWEAPSYQCAEFDPTAGGIQSCQERPVPL